MIAFTSMLKSAAIEAGMKVPEDLDEYDINEYPHWHVFCVCQIGKSVKYHGEHWDNAKIVASFSDEDIKKALIDDLIKKGFSW